MSKQKPQSWRDVLEVHGAASLFPIMSPNELRALGEDIKQKGLSVPVVLWQASNDAASKLLDGRNRLDAMEAIGLPVVDAEGKLLIASQRCGVEVDPYEYVLSANLYRRHLTTRQRLELLDKVAKANPNISSRRIAKLVGVSPTKAAKRRHELEASGDVSTVDTSADTKGRKQPTRKARHTTAHSIADRNAKALVVADCAEEPSQQTKRLDEQLQNAARAVELVVPKRSDVERELPDADQLVRNIIARDAIEPGYARTIARGIADHLSGGFPEMPDFLKRTA